MRHDAEILNEAKNPATEIAWAKTAQAIIHIIVEGHEEKEKISILNPTHSLQIGISHPVLVKLIHKGKNTGTHKLLLVAGYTVYFSPVISYRVGSILNQRPRQKL